MTSLDYLDFELEYEDEYQQTVRTLEDFRLEILDTLLASETLKVHVKDVHGRTPLHCVKYHASSNVESDVESPPMSVRTLQRLIAKGAVSSKDDRGCLPLHLACEAGDTAAAKLLLERYAELEDVDHKGCNSLLFAAKGKNLDTIRMIMEAAKRQGRGKDLMSATDASGQNALHYVFHNSWVGTDVVAYLVDMGTVAGEQDMNGMSPLAIHLKQMSMNGGHTAELMEVLFGAGADPAYLSNEGLGYHHMYAQTALVLGIEPFGVLQRYGLDITTTDNGGRSLLHYCAMNGHCTTELLDFFTGLGIPLQTSDAAGITPLQYANIAILRVPHLNEWDSDRWGPSRATLHEYIGSRL